MRTRARIIDANSNRAAEGLRVIEDIARFAIEDAQLAARTKAARHTLTETVRALPTAPGLAARDTPGDVGTDTRTPGEYRREDLAEIARAASGRATQALRVIEELAKSFGADASAFESLRYETYELARLVSAGLRPRAPQWRLCVLITEALCNHPWQRTVEAAIEGGADALQLREKDIPDRERLRRARRLVEITRAAPRWVWAVINDRPDIALLSRADAVHVGQHDLSPADVRAVAGHNIPVGVSTSSIETARRAVDAGASSLGLGPMFPSTTKPKHETPGPDYLRALLADEELADIPHLCIGGITPENAPQLVRAGARGLAVCSAVCSSDDPAGACRAILDAFTDVREQPPPDA